MVKFRFVALAVALGTAVSSPSVAASVVMVQFGSFETQSEAQSRLSDVKSKHADALGGISATVREVTLPPDNLTVYRTQAGPLPSRSAAQSVCSKLASSGDECYVVETAMQPNMAVAAADTAPAMPALNGASASPSPAVSATDSAPAPSMSALPPASLASSAPMADSAMAPASVSPVTVLAPIDATPAQPSAGMQAAMDRAVAEDAAATNNTTLATSTDTAAPARGFWSRVNPFNGTATTHPAAETPPAAPAPAMAADATASTTMTEADHARAQENMAASIPAPASRPMPMPAAPAQNIAMTSRSGPEPLAPIAVEPMHLPPPPPPLMAMNQPVPAASMPPAPAIAARPLTPMPGTQQTPTPPQWNTNNIAYAPAGTPFKVSPSVPTGGGEMQGNDQGNVRVEEARRVPLTQMQQPSVPPLAMAIQPPVSLSPSATLGQKTIWAAIGMFPDTQTALAFWDSYRQIHPDFPAVRVRVAAPLRSSTEKVSLRVGPFARDAFVNTLCGSIGNPNLHCGRMIDLGVAATTSAVPGYLPGSRYNRP